MSLWFIFIFLFLLSASVSSGKIWIPGGSPDAIRSPTHRWHRTNHPGCHSNPNLPADACYCPSFVCLFSLSGSPQETWGARSVCACVLCAVNQWRVQFSVLDGVIPGIPQGGLKGKARIGWGSGWRRRGWKEKGDRGGNTSMLSNLGQSELFVSLRLDIMARNWLLLRFKWNTNLSYKIFSAHLKGEALH